MSLTAAKAMHILADCLEEEAKDMPAGQGFQMMAAMGRAHRKAAERIEAAWAEANAAISGGDGPRFNPKAKK